MGASIRGRVLGPTLTAGDAMKVCKHLGCDNPHHARGLCNLHYVRVRNGNVGEPSSLFGVFGRTTCEQCDREPMGGGRWCPDHFTAYVRDQDKARPRRRGNPAGTDSDPSRVAVKRGHVAIPDRRWAA